LFDFTVFHLFSYCKYIQYFIPHLPKEAFSFRTLGTERKIQYTFSNA
jgi:hypothetical protein